VFLRQEFILFRKEFSRVSFALGRTRSIGISLAAVRRRIVRPAILFTPGYDFIAAQCVDGYRKWLRNRQAGLACRMKMAVVRSNVVFIGNPGFKSG